MQALRPAWAHTWTGLAAQLDALLQNLAQRLPWFAPDLEAPETRPSPCPARQIKRSNVQYEPHGSYGHLPWI